MSRRHPVMHPCDTDGCHADPLDMLVHGQEIIMGVLDDLRAADTELADEVHALADEQATFLADVLARLAGNENDPAAIAQVVADMHDRVGELRALADAQRAADPGPLPAAHADPASTLDPAQVPPHDGVPELTVDEPVDATSPDDSADATPVG